MARKAKKLKRYPVFLSLLREARERSGLTQEAIANALGAPQSFVSKSELGERRMDIVDLLDYLQAIGTPPGRFVEDLVQRMRAPVSDAVKKDRRRK